MLQTIRERAQGWIAWAIVILISIPFALWGIQSYLGVGGEPIAATVNGVEIPARELDRRVQETRFELRERLGAAYDPAAFDDQRLRAEVLETLIQEALLMDVVGRLGLRDLGSRGPDADPFPIRPSSAMGGSTRTPMSVCCASRV
jgi:peptidyl-prolyl cis-trans isomerase D